MVTLVQFKIAHPDGVDDATGEVATGDVVTVVLLPEVSGPTSEVTLLSTLLTLDETKLDTLVRMEVTSVAALDATDPARDVADAAARLG